MVKNPTSGLAMSNFRSDNEWLPVTLMSVVRLDLVNFRSDENSSSGLTKFNFRFDQESTSGLKKGQLPAWTKVNIRSDKKLNFRSDLKSTSGPTSSQLPVWPQVNFRSDLKSTSGLTFELTSGPLNIKHPVTNCHMKIIRASDGMGIFSASFLRWTNGLGIFGSLPPQSTI